MKKTTRYNTLTKRLFFLFFGILTQSLVFAQAISFSFSNAATTNDGSDSFYEIDVLVASDADFKLGSGQLYFNYNTAAFGENIQTSGNLEFLRPDGSILAEQIGTAPFIFDIYKDFIQNDNTTSRVSISFQQNITAQFIPANNITSVPTLLCRLKIRFQDPVEAPMLCFEDQAPFDNQFFSACANDGSTASADCTNYAGTQITDDSFDCTIDTLSANDFEVEAILSVYPNPNRGVIYVANPQQLALTKAIVFDLTGRIVKNVRLDEAGAIIRLDISNLPNAPYLMTLEGEGMAITKKFIKN